MPRTVRCDLFCTVIDNFGDAGVCWRLARQLARERHWHIRLFIDRPDILAALLPPAPDPHTASLVSIEAWPDTSSQEAMDSVVAALPDVVIEAFACELPASYIDAMARAASHGRPPVWINLDYLSAEDWVADYHLGQSRHPRLPLDKTFFFPGMRDGTGGLLREHDLDERRRAFLGDPTRRTAFWREIGIAPPSSDQTVVTLFAYDNPALPALLAQWSAAGAQHGTARQSICLLVPEGRISHGVGAFFGRGEDTPLRAGEQAQCGRLHAYAIPFVDQDRYDQLLWQADLNFVRGEDSFVRAQWARRPSVWHIYPQSDDAHFDKLEAALALYIAGLPGPAGAAVIRFWHAWNGRGTVNWADFWQHRDAFMRWVAPDEASNGAERHTTRRPGPEAEGRADAKTAGPAEAPVEGTTGWEARLRAPGSLAANLAEFAESRLK